MNFLSRFKHHLANFYDIIRFILIATAVVLVLALALFHPFIGLPIILGIWAFAPPLTFSKLFYKVLGNIKSDGSK